MMPTEPPYADVLRRLAFNDVRTVDALLSGSINSVDDLELGDKTVSLLRVAALIASDAASSSSYQWAVAAALATGARENEIVSVLLRIAPIVGVARLASAARSLSGALGLELDELEPD